MINISDYLDSNKDREFNRNNSKSIEQEEDSLISSRNLKLFTKNILMQLNEAESQEEGSSAGPQSGNDVNESKQEETFEYDIDEF